MSMKDLTIAEWWYLNAFAITCFISALAKDFYLLITYKEMGFLSYMIIFLTINLTIEFLFSKILKQTCKITNSIRYWLNIAKFILITCCIDFIFFLFGFNRKSSVSLWLIFCLVVLFFESRIFIEKMKESEWV